MSQPMLGRYYNIQAIKAIIICCLVLLPFGMGSDTAGGESEAPVNDECSSAKEIVFGELESGGSGAIELGSTLLATADNEFACGSASETLAPGVWFSVVGNGVFLQASTCSALTTYDTQISVFSGECGDLVCVSGNDDSCGVESTVNWMGSVGTTYYIVVHGFTFYAGEFELSVIQVVNEASADAPSNDLCSGSLSLSQITAEDVFSSASASVDPVVACGDSTDGAAPGVWFSVTGTGEQISVSTCGQSTDYDTQISVYANTCESLECVDGNDDSCGLQSLVTWDSEVGTEYFILIHGFDSSSGTFGLTVEGVEAVAPGETVAEEEDQPPEEEEPEPEQEEPQEEPEPEEEEPETEQEEPEQEAEEPEPSETEIEQGPAEVQVMDLSTNSCENPYRLTLNEAYSGSTVSAAVPDIEACGDASVAQSASVWFSIVGSGNRLEANTCGMSSFDTQLSVFSGDCSGLTCVDGNDDGCGVHSVVTWNAEVGVTYYVIVHGYSTGEGDYGIIVRDLTASEDIPPNDDCSGAIQLTNVAPTDLFSTVAATADFDIETCGTATASTGPGIWFTVAGTGGPLSVGMCDMASFDTQMSIFTGSCDSLACFDGNDDSCDVQSSIAWDSQVGTVYYILVHGFAYAAGNFSLSFEGVEFVGAPTDDVCEGAKPLSLSEEMIASTGSATVDEVSSCGHATSGTAPGVWFSLAGTGNILQVSTCTEATNFDTQISVFIGECGTLECLDGNDDGCEGPSIVRWESEQDTTYYILVHGFQDAVGQFGILAEEFVGSGVANDDCSDALPLLIDHLQQNSTRAAMVDTVDICGSATGSTAPGVWFSIVGTGNLLRASTCDMSSFDTQMSVFTGGCEDLVCVDGNDDECSAGSSVSWASELNSVYYILVHGFGIATGDFSIVVNDIVITNDVCDDALPMLPGTPELSSTLLAALDSVPACGDATASTAPGLWYSIAGTGNFLQASTCGSYFDTQVSVFTGTCNNLACVGGNDDAACEKGSLVVWESEEGSMYYVLVHGFEESVGTFTLQFGERSIPDNDDCQDAFAVVPNDGWQAGTTVLARVDTIVECGGISETTTGGVWYTVAGTGNSLRATTCGFSTAFLDMQISVFMGSCNGLICLAAKTAGCDAERFVVWESVANTNYYVLVHGFGSADGPFELSIDEVFEADDTCQGAFSLQLGQPFVGTTVLASVPDVKGCGGVSSGRSSGVWFSVVGTGRRLEANTCGISDFDTQIAILMGTCDNLICVDGNDDWCGVQSAVGWESELGTTYYVVVYGYHEESGDFRLIVDEGDATAEVLVEVPENENCTEAINLELDVTETVTFWTHGAMAEANVEGCGTATASTGPGIWFTVRGTGNPLRISTCDLSSFDTQISLFEGSCDNLVCVEGNDDACGVQSSVVLNSQANTLYYVLVHGYAYSAGNFSVSLEDLLTNDDCPGAMSLPLGGLEVVLSTSAARMDTISSCGNATGGNARGVWFTVTGTGNPLKASTCFLASDFDTQISVFTGSCDSLECVDGNDDWCGGLSSVTWDSELDTDYYVIVHGFQSSSGQFGLSVQEVLEVSPNDDCVNAVPLLLSEPRQGSTVIGTVDRIAACGSATESTAPGVWFSVTGTGGSLEASTCDNTGYDTQVSLFTGTCDALSCVDGDDDGCLLQSKVIWESELDADYYILVHGFGLASGNFTITLSDEVDAIPEEVAPEEEEEAEVEEEGELEQELVEEEAEREEVLEAEEEETVEFEVDDVEEVEEVEVDEELPANDICEGAVVLSLGEVVDNSTVSATADTSGICGGKIFGTGPGVWFVVRGTGAILQVSTCDLSEFDTQVFVFSGSCNDLDCVDGNDDFCGTQSSVTWASKASEQYYILVHGPTNSRGDFGIVFTETSPPSNDECEAAALAPFGEVLEGSTIAAFVDELGSCGSASKTTAPGVWYFVTGTGGPLSASTCDLTSLDTQISIYVGKCGSLICVDGNDQSCGDQSSVVWDTELFDPYYILVHGSGAAVGDFGIRIDEFEQQPAPTNDECGSALALEMDVLSEGNTESATMDNVNTCGSAVQSDAPGVWFSVVGTGTLVQASTCDLASFDTQIAVFTGSCDNLDCVEGNDDSCNVQSTVVWKTAIGQVYHVLVTGFELSSGEFGIKVKTLDNPPRPTILPNDDCSGAIPLTLGIVQKGSTDLATKDAVDACGASSDGSSPGVWFSIDGIGKLLQVSTCSLSVIDTQISVFSGQCDKLTCIDGNDDWCDKQSLVSWESEVGTTYYILVHGFFSDSGEFGLQVEG